MKNPKYGTVPGTLQFIDFPCGKCEACLRRKQSTWFTRLKFQQIESDYCCFVTLTYDEEHLPQDKNVCKEDVQLFHKRLRSYLRRPKVFKFYLTSEYGPQTFRPHYHAIYYGIPADEWPKIEQAWQKGFVTIDQVTDGRLRYVTGYVIEKLFVPPGREPLFNLISKGLGASYVQKYASWHRVASMAQRAYVPYHGSKLPLPRYYKEKLYSDGARKVYARQLTEKADQKFREVVSEVGLNEYLRQVRSRTDNYVDKVRKAHKKKKFNQTI